MPKIDDPAELLAHLRGAINGKAHWVFVTDTEAGISAGVGLVVAVMAVGGKEPTAGWLDHINARSGVRGSVGFITAAKGAATDAAVLAWLRGVAGQTPAAGQDLLLVTDDDKVLMALVNDIRSGAVRLTGSDAGLN